MLHSLLLEFAWADYDTAEGTAAETDETLHMDTHPSVKQVISAEAEMLRRISQAPHRVGRLMSYAQEPQKSARRFYIRHASDIGSSADNVPQQQSQQLAQMSLEPRSDQWTEDRRGAPRPRHLEHFLKTASNRCVLSLLVMLTYDPQQAECGYTSASGLVLQQQSQGIFLCQAALCQLA
ncbi:hypothetical protein WJX82_001965 [Trebouxia sp. C0006]